MEINNCCNYNYCLHYLIGKNYDNCCHYLYSIVLKFVISLIVSTCFMKLSLTNDMNFINFLQPILNFLFFCFMHARLDQENGCSLNVMI